MKNDLNIDYLAVSFAREKIRKQILVLENLCIKDIFLTGCGGQSISQIHQQYEILENLRIQLLDLCGKIQDGLLDVSHSFNALEGDVIGQLGNREVQR
ncbi:MAG: hypothetical protein LBR25_09375 [Erysipelotrichaceae bacterium]|jgi:hypothetical protein|nr:hypothetical protein [Erysipelotrichaceae bacterium]